MIKIVSLIFVLLSFLYSQKADFEFEKITIKDGLNQNTVSVMMQDQQGFLWFGTPNGINRYDGYSFKFYRNFSNGDDQNASIRVNTIAEDANANIWIGTSYNGLAVFNTKTGTFKVLEEFNENIQAINTIFVDSKNYIWVGSAAAGLKKYDLNFKLLEHHKFSSYENSIASNNITSIIEDEPGNIWIGTADAGLNMFNPESKNFASIKIIDQNVSITTLNQDAAGNIWIGTEKEGLILLDKHSGNTTKYQQSINNKSSIAQNTIHTIFRDSQDRFWIGTNNGLSLFNSDKSNFQNFYNNPTNPASLSGNQILNIFEDRSGIIWISANQNGLNRFSKSFAAFSNYYHNPLNSNSLSSDEVWAIHEVNYNNLWIGSSNGLTHWNRNRNTFEHYHPKSNPITHNVIRAIDGFKNDKLIIGTDGGGINIFSLENGSVKSYINSNSAESISSNFIRDFLRNKDGTYWIATMDGLNLFDPVKETFVSYKNIPGDKTSLSDNRILDIEKDTNGNIWLATYNGLCVFYTNIQEFKTFKNDPNNNNSLSHNETINLFYSSKEENLIWVSTEFGLNEFDITNEIWTRHVQEEQANNVIYSITPDMEGFFWLGTNKGISRYNRKDGTFRNFDQNDGIRNYEFNSDASASIMDGSILLGGLAGISGFVPGEMQKNAVIPNIVITAFKKFGETIAIDSILSNDDGLLELTHQDKYVSIEFAALDFNNSSKNQYRYKLEGFDKDWINAGNSRSASYTNLTGGMYTFRVIGSNNDGVWNEKGASLKIKVNPPFWTTWWFQFLLFVVVFVLVYRIYKNRTLYMKRQRHELQKEVSAQTRELFKNNLNLQQIQYENQSILRNVEEGLFILNEQMVIQSQYSAAFLEILETASPDGMKLIDLLNKHLPEKDMSLVRDYLGFVFDHHLDEELIKDLNPLTSLEFTFADGISSKSKYLTFKFKRIKKEKKVSMLIVTVIDNTKEYQLSQQLELNEEKAKAQVELLMGVLHLDAGLLNEFMNFTYKEIAKIENLLQTSHKENEYKEVLNNLDESIGILKQNAINIDLKFFLSDLITIETKIDEIHEKNKITGMDFLPLVLKFKDVKKHLDELKSLVERITKFSNLENENIVLEEH